MAGSTGPRLTPEQREMLIEWLAADYSTELIRHWFEERGWPVISRQALHGHRQRMGKEIEVARGERRARALTTGLALKDERVERLKAHADELEKIKWVPDEKGWLRNEKPWRETLDDIAREVGHRRTGVDLNVGKLSDDELLTEATALLNGEGAGGTAGGDPPWSGSAGEDE